MPRRPPRVPLVVDVEYADGRAPLRRRTRDIGRGGLFIATPHPLPEGAPVRVRLALPGQPESMSIEAAVAWAEPLLGMGLRFTWLAPDDEAAIRRYVADHQGRAADSIPASARASVGQSDDPDAPGRGAPALDVPPRTLYLALATDALRTRVRDFLAREGFGPADRYPALLAVPLADGALPRVSTGLRALLGEAERELGKAMLLTGSSRPTLADLLWMPSLGRFLGALEGEWLAAMLREERLVSHFQPIVHAGAPGAVFGYEALVRGQAPDGSLVPPLDLYAMGRRADLLFPLDRLARLSAVRGAATYALIGRLFINVNPASLGSTDEHLGATREAIADVGIPPGQIVFEIVESDRIGDVPQLLRMLETYRAAGFGVALDDLGAGYSSLALLAQLRPDFVKLDMALVRGIDQDPYRGEIVARLLESARALGIRTVAEGVETDGEWAWFRAHGVDLVQGFLFARPALPPPLPQLPPPTA